MRRRRTSGAVCTALALLWRAAGGGGGPPGDAIDVPCARAWQIAPPTAEFRLEQGAHTGRMKMKMRKRGRRVAGCQHASSVCARCAAKGCCTADFDAATACTELELVPVLFKGSNLCCFVTCMTWRCVTAVAGHGGQANSGWYARGFLVDHPQHLLMRP